MAEIRNNTNNEMIVGSTRVLGRKSELFWFVLLHRMHRIDAALRYLSQSPRTPHNPIQPANQPTNANCLPLCSALCNDYSFGYCFNSFGISRRRETLLRHHTHNTTIVRTTCYSCTQAFWLCFRGSARNLWKTIFEREFSAHRILQRGRNYCWKYLIRPQINTISHTSCNIISFL